MYINGYIISKVDTIQEFNILFKKNKFVHTNRVESSRESSTTVHMCSVYIAWCVLFLYLIGLYIKNKIK